MSSKKTAKRRVMKRKTPPEAYPFAITKNGAVMIDPTTGRYHIYDWRMHEKLKQRLFNDEILVRVRIQEIARG